jgi:hypothetical protein
MKEQIPQPNSSKDVENEQEKEREQLYDSAKMKINALFYSHENGRESVDALKAEIDKAEFLENKDAIKMELEKCADIKTKKEFIESVFKILKPVIDLKIEKPEIFIGEGEASQEFVKINELLSYVIVGNIIDIHMLPEEKVENLPLKFKEGLQKLAEIVDKNKDIETIEARSWINAEHPNFMKRFGFTIDGEISEEIRLKYFPREKRKISDAHMSRNDFLKRYLTIAGSNTVE